MKHSARTLSLLALFIVPLCSLESKMYGQGAENFIRGDTNLDFRITYGDLVRLSLALSGIPGVSLGCDDAADVDDNGALELFSVGGESDLTKLSDWLFSLTPATTPALLPAPYPNLGADTTADRLTCLQGPTRPVPGNPRFTMSWEAPTGLRPGAEGSIYLLATAPEAIFGFSLALEVNTQIIDIVAVDFEDTSLPAGERTSLIASPFFRTAENPTTGTNTLLLVGATFISTTGGLINFGATNGSITNERLLRIRVRSRRGAPLSGSPVTVISDFTAPYPSPADVLVGMRPASFPDGGLDEITILPPVSFIINDAPDFLRADSNRDMTVDVSDPIHILNFLFNGGPAPDVLDAADSNDDGTVDIADPIYALCFLFGDAEAPPKPFPGCGFDPTDDPLANACGQHLVCPDCAFCCNG